LLDDSRIRFIRKALGRETEKDELEIREPEIVP
jgi:hypothetical protein